MSLIGSILLLLLLSRIAGEIAERYGQPSLIGEILAGVLLGPSLLNWVHVSTEIQTVADLGVLLLVFLAGMEMDLEILGHSVRGRGLWVGVVGFITPLVLGLLVGLLFGLDITRTVFLGLCIAITALPVSIRILMDQNILRTDIAQKIIAAAIINDVASLLILGVILDVEKKAGTWEMLLTSLGWSLLKASLFMASVVAASRIVRYATARVRAAREDLSRWLPKPKGKETLFALTLLFVLGFATLSESLGLHFVVGALFGSMLISHEMLGRKNFEEVQKTASSITMGFLGPIFFAMIGLQFNAMALRDWKLVVAILAAAIAGKIIGGYWGAQLAGMNRQECLAVGIGLNGRGVMELVVASIALSSGFIGSALFTTLVLMGLVTTFITPVLLRRVLPNGAETLVESRSAVGEIVAGDADL